jgi:ferredoxin
MSRMVQIHFLLEDMIVEAPQGMGLQEIVEATGADVTFGCGTGSCGTCRVHLRGACSPPGREERDFLRDLHAAPGERLACQVKVLGDLEVEYLGL